MKGVVKTISNLWMRQMIYAGPSIKEEKNHLVRQPMKLKISTNANFTGGSQYRSGYITETSSLSRVRELFRNLTLSFQSSTYPISTPFRINIAEVLPSVNFALDI